MYKLVTDNVDIISNSNNISWKYDAETLGTQLSFETLKDLFEGQVISLFNDNKELFRGVAINKKPNRWTFSYVAQDYSFYLKNKVIKQFNNIKASEAIKSLLAEAYIISDIVEIPTLITKIYKNKSISEIIDDILELAQQDQGIKYFKEIESNILYVRKLSDMKINPSILLPKDINLESSIENMKNKIQVVVNGEDNNSIYATAEDSSQRNWYGLLSDIVQVDEKDIAQAQNIANNKLNEVNKIERKCSINGIIVISDNDTIKANRLIYLNAGSRLCGYYKIKSANHTLSKGLHKVDLEIEW